MSNEEDENLSDFSPDESPPNKAKRKLANKVKKPPKNHKIGPLKKVKYEAITEDSSHKKKSSIFKPPTVEELNELKETENLFNNNLFRLQIEELIKEVEIKSKYRRIFDTWYRQFNDIIGKLPDHEISSDKLQKQSGSDKFLKSFTQRPDPFPIKCDQEFVMKFTKPQGVEKFGLDEIKSLPGPQLVVNVNVKVPRVCFHVKDYLNNRYFAKRYYYLKYVATFMEQNDIKSEWKLHEGNIHLPILEIGLHDHKVVVRIYATPEDNYFRPSRLVPSVNNIKSDSCYEGLHLKNDDLAKETPNVFYNSSLAFDVTLSDNTKLIHGTLIDLKNVQEAIKLIHIWLNQRQLLSLLGSSDFFILYLMAYLVIKKRVNKHMSSYQVVRNFWSFIRDHDLRNNPIGLCEDTKDLGEDFECQFLDNSGCFNVLFLMKGPSIYDKLRFECDLAFKLLDEGGIQSFHSLFISRIPQLLQYDLILDLNIDNFNRLIKSCDDLDKIKYYNFHDVLLVKKVTKILEQGLYKRASLIVPLVSSESGLNNRPKKLSFGINLNGENAFNFLEMGPSLNDPKEKDFRDFWTHLSSDRRFKDGSVCVAVYFETKTIKDKRALIKTIIDYLIVEKLGLKNYTLRYNEMEDFVTDKNISPSYPIGTNEECCLKIIKTSDELGKKLRNLDMPLTITGIQGTSDCYCFTDLFPAVSTSYKFGGKLSKTVENNIVLHNKRVGIIPRYVKPIENILNLEHSSKWPQDLQAIKHMKTAFYLEISKLLAKKYDVISNVTHDYFDVLYEGLVFRYRLFISREVGLLKQETTDNGVTVYKDTEDSRNMEIRFNIQPKIVSALKGIQAQSPTFGVSTTLIKRWLRSHLIDDYHFPDLVIDLINASLFLNKSVFGISNAPQVAFLRFLKFMTELQWDIQPVIVNFNDEITKQHLTEIDSKLLRSRDSCPNLYLAIPYDGCESIFTTKTPSKEVLRRVKHLALETLNFFTTSAKIEGIFTPNLDGFDAIIHLKPLLNPRRHENHSFVLEDGQKIKLEPFNPNTSTKIPVVGFNPIDLYLNALRTNYGQFAHFFHDPYGGNLIGVLWNPKALEDVDFKVTSVNGRKLRDDGKLGLNLDGLMEDFFILGNNLVKSIDNKKHN